MKATIQIELDITPGTYTPDEIVADLQSRIYDTALQLGFGYGPLPYKVVSAKVVRAGWRLDDTAHAPADSSSF